MWHRMVIAGVAMALAPMTMAAQAPLAGGFAGRSIEAHAFYQSVSNDYGDWHGAYGRFALPSERDVLFGDLLVLNAFRQHGILAGIAQRHDWNDRVFQLLGWNVGDGAAILPKYRVDGLLGYRWGEHRAVQTIAGASYVRSVSELEDVAAIAAITWYAPRNLVLETGVRYNTSNPGSIRSQRVHGIATWTPNAHRTFSTRIIAGTEGWQIVSETVTLTRFASQEAALAWREKVNANTAVSVQLDAYHNPYYTRSGVTLGVARYW